MCIRENISNIKTEIPENVKLIAVSKTKPIEKIQQAYQCGVRDFGENKVQELINKYDYFPKDVKWHLLGHLQRNKVKYIVGKVYLIHSLDSIKLLQEIEAQYKKHEENANVLIEINIGREESKTGIFEEDLEKLLLECEKCDYVKVKGIMAVIPLGDEDSCKRYFKNLKSIFDHLKTKSFKNISMEYLSMGMTHDYNYAIAEGSNMIRIGEGIFGKRIYNNK